MKKLFFIGLYLILFVVIANAQTDSTFYYYQGGKIYLHYNKSVIHLTLKSDCAINENDLHADDLHYYRNHQPNGSEILLENYEPFSPIPESVLNKYMSDSRFANVGYTLERNGHLFYTKNLFIVRLKENITWDEFERLLDDNACQITEVCSWLERQYVISVGNRNDDLINISNLFFESGLFEYSAPNFLWVNAFNSNDTYYSQQWALKNTGQDGGTLGIDINIEKAWTITQGSANIKVAVVDDGVDLTHPDLVLNLLSGYDPTGNNSAGDHVWNFEKHGTACAGIIAATANNIGVVGVAPYSKIIPIHSGSSEGGNDPYSASNGISWACQHGADVINVSWGGGTPLDILDLAINYANSDGRNGKGCVIVAASGNNNSSNVDYPSNLYDVISVGAIDRCGVRSGRVDAILETQPCDPWDDNARPGSSYGEGLSVVAPGTNIYTTDRQGTKGFNHSIGANGNYYASFGGTSAACPHVSGVAALMLSINPNLTSQEVRDIIEQTAKKTRKDVYYYTDTIGHPNGEWNKYMGYGLVDAHCAVLKAAFNSIYGSSTMSYCDVQTFTVQNTHNENISNITFSWTCSENLHILSGANAASVSVKGSGIGTGWLKCTVYHLGDSVSSGKQVTVIYNSSETLYDNISITANTTWSNTCTINGIISVEPLSTLTITGTVHSTSSARLIVRPGGKLVVDGGTLTSACPNEMWQGIEVVGDRTKRQLQKFQGTVELRNGAVIENALCGIYTGLHGDTVYATTGGIISATNTIFKNNRQSVMINSYAYTTPSGSIANYNSTFSRCTFTKDNNNLFAANNTAFAEHVRLWDVKGVTFEGCTFNDLTSSALGKGRGIYAADAGVLVNTYCPPQPTSVCECPETDATYSFFSGFTTAVEVNTSGNPYAVRTDEVRFSNNSTGVSIYGNHFATVTRCQFNLDQWPVSSKGNIGLYLNGCSGYTVEENTFMRTFYPTSPLTTDNSTGICVRTSGITANSLYRNVFEKLTKGIHVIGINGSGTTGLRMTCNDFSNGKYDIHIAAKANVAHNQGTAVKGADNIFVSTITSSIFNESMDVINYYYGNGSAPISPYQVTTHSGAAANLCASTLCDGGGTPKSLAQFQSDADADTYYAAVRTLMSDTVLDLNELEQWHTAAQSANLANYVNIGDPYSLTETRFMEGYVETFTADVDDAEMANYAEFHAMKLALVNDNADNDNNDNADNQDNNNSQNSFNSLFINWYALTPSQIAQLQTIAERNTGRASVMAKGVLCFFHGICYEDEWDDAGVFDTPLRDGDTMATRAKHTAMDTDNDATLSVYPNPTEDILFVELRGSAGIANMALYDLQGRVVGTRFIASATGASATVNMRDIPAGVYVLRVTDADGHEYHQKIVRK